MSSHEPTVSVITPAYNRERYGWVAIRSALEQTFSDFERPVVDDGSTDGSAAAVPATAEPRIRHIHQANGGRPVVPMNRGMRELLDSDDWFLPHALQAHADAFRRHPDVGRVYGWSDCTDDSGAEHGLVGPKRDDLPRRVFEMLSLDHCFLLPSASAVRRRVLGDLRGFDEAAERSVVEDCGHWSRACAIASTHFESGKVGLASCWSNSC